MSARRWMRWIGIGFILLAVVAVGLAMVLESGVGQTWIRNVMTREIERRTGTHVEMRSFRLDPWDLRFEIDDLTVHGLETPGSPPLLHADNVSVSLRILSFLGRRIALDQLIVDHAN